VLLFHTGGRPLRCPLPPDISEGQIRWLVERLPTKIKLQRSTEHSEPSVSARGEDSEARLDSLRTLTQQVCEKKIELIELERETSARRLELQQLNFQIDERRKHARSFAGTLGDLMTAFEGRNKKP